jgi:ABC-type Fe3+-siderophore transport system permease subunit
MNSLFEAVRVLHGRDLSEVEKESLIRFQKIYEIGDDDPLVVVLAMVGAHRILLESVPDVLFQKAMEAIELHQLTLCEQSTLIAKELIITLSQHIKSAMEQEQWKVRWPEYVIAFMIGCSFGGIVFGKLF